MPIVLPPKDRGGQLDAMVAQIMQQVQQRDMEQRRLEQDESQFLRSREDRLRVDDAQIGTLDAQRQQAAAMAAKAAYERAAAAAGDFMKPIEAHISRAIASGDEPGGRTVNQRIGEAMKFVQSAPELQADPEMMKVILNGTAAYAFLASQPSLGSDVVAGNTTEANRRATSNVLTPDGGIGGGSFVDQNRATMLASKSGNEQLTAPVVPRYIAQENGPAAVRSLGRVVSEQEPSQSDKETTRREIAKQQVANAGQIEQESIRQRGESDRAAGKAAESEGAAAVGTARKGAEQSAEIVRLVDSLIGNEEAGVPEHPGFRGAVGAKNLLAQPGIGPFQKDEPFSYSDEAAAKKSIQQLVAIATIPQMQVMKGLGQQSDREFANVQASATALSTDIPEAAFKAEALRLRDNAAALMDRYERLKRTAEKHFNGNINQAAAYIRSHGGEL